MQFFMSIWLNHGKGIIPNVNLSSNIGTVDDATHRMSPGNIIDYLKSELPKLTKDDVNNFIAYVQQSQITINEELINDLMKESIQNNELYKNTNVDFLRIVNTQFFQYIAE